MTTLDQTEAADTACAETEPADADHVDDTDETHAMTDYAPESADLAPPPVAVAVAAGDTPRSVADGGTPVPGSTLSAEELEQLTADIVAALKTVNDPEIPADIYELGLIYRIDIADDRVVTIDMTLTSPGCPVAGEMPGMVENAVNSVPGVQSTSVNLTFDPPWDKDRMSEEAKLACGMY